MNVNPDLKRIVAERAARERKALNDVVTDLICKALDLDPADYPVPRGTPGRKRVIVAEKKKRGTP